MKKFLTLALSALVFGQVDAQVRYLNEVFTDVDVSTNVVYGSNVTVLPLLQGAPPTAQPLVCDIYEPAGDTETDRPLLIYIHTGNFLPQYLNGSAVGNKNDSVAVELCTRYAKMGYVVASIDYRLGWNPLAATQAQRTYQLINAAYRGVQDARTAVRFFRASVDGGDPYGIDANMIGYMGEGTGGYVSYAASTISDYNDIILDDAGAPIAKFWYDPGDGSFIPMVIQEINGNPEATSDGYAPAGVFGPNPVQLCIANHVGYSSDVNFQVNLGGALGDLNWLDSGDPAMISFQCPADQFAPYTTGVLVVPTTGENVVEVSGAFDVHDEINAQPAPNNNAVFQALGLSDPVSAQAVANGNQGWDGLYPVRNNYVNGTPTQPYDGAPWQWWDVATTQMVDAANGTSVAATQLTLNPNMGPLEGRAYCDTIVAYAAPRMAAILDLVSTGPGCTDGTACNFNALATSDDGSCTYADPGYNCAGEPIAEGCTSPMACNYDNTATLDDGSCDYLETTTIPTGSETVWLVGLTLTGTPFEAIAGGCEAGGGVNPNVSINGVILGDGSAPLAMAGISDPTGLLGELAALAATVEFGICGDNITVSALGNIIPMVSNGTFWKSPIAVNADGQYLWAAPMANFNIGCGDPGANNFTSPCDLSLACTYDVTLRVNMANETVSGDGVHVAGEFQGWDPGATQASVVAYGIYQVTVSLPNGAHEYKFVNGNQWGSDEVISGDCAADGTTNRVVVVAGGDVTTGTPCFGSCDSCAGCTNPLFAEYDPFATSDNGSCGSAVVAGCTYSDAENFNPIANQEDGSCTFAGGGNDCPGDLDGDGTVATADLLGFLSFFGGTCL
ncbi:MAG: hypothetical protein O3B70_02600 [Bacteroidetes bacterium]|nr:hypothetical protein [Bacteroidota bacterium]MDA0903199.1 hypothetical protein [Bacteroidota bacterium]MDA1242242.1 hypothetical protein [Bacteroidota bacterium]